MRNLVTAMMLALLFSYSNNAMAAVVHDSSVTTESVYEEFHEAFQSVGFMVSDDDFSRPAHTVYNKLDDRTDSDQKLELGVRGTPGDSGIRVSENTYGILGQYSSPGDSGGAWFDENRYPFIDYRHWAEETAEERANQLQKDTVRNGILTALISTVFLVAGRVSRRAAERKREVDAMFTCNA